MKRTLTSFIRDESGQGALTMVLIMLILGTLIITPLLGLMGTGLRAGQMHEERMAEFYAADSGVEDALYKIQNEEVPDWMKGVWDKDVYEHVPYSYPEPPCPPCKLITKAWR